MKDPDNCPYCEAEEKGYSEGWGFSPEGWEMMHKIHLEKHCDRCPNCGIRLEHFSGLEHIPEYFYCPECNDRAYNEGGEVIARLE